MASLSDHNFWLQRQEEKNWEVNLQNKLKLYLQYYPGFAILDLVGTRYCHDGPTGPEGPEKP
jgi:hypothetical protein